MVRRHLALVLMLFVVIAGSGIAATWYRYSTDPRYEAEARIRIDPATSRDPRMIGSPDVVPTPLMDQYIQTQVRMIQNNEVLNRVFDDGFARLIGSRTTGLNANERTIARDLGPGTPEDSVINRISERQNFLLGNRAAVLGGASEPATMLRDNLKVNQLLRTNLITVRLEGRDPALIAHTVNAVVDSYMLAVKADRKDRNARRVENLRTQESALADSLRILQTRIETFVSTHNVLFPTTGGEMMQRLNLIERQLIEAQAKLREARIMNDQMKRLAQQDLSEAEILETLSPATRLQMDMDRETGMLVAQKHELSRNKESLLERLAPAHDHIRGINSQIATVDQQLELRRKTLARTLLDQQRLMVENEFAMSEATEAELRAEHQKVRSDVATAVSRQTELDNLRQQHDQVRDSLNEVRKAIRETEIAAEVSENVISIAEVARAPGQEGRVGNPLLYSSLAVLLALALSVSMALMVELIDNRVRTPQQVVRTVQLPVLGVVPDGREDPATRSVSNLSKVAMNAPQSLFAESFRQLRTALLYSTDTDLKTLLVTSPQSGEGKTMVSSNLAVTLANGGSKVLLVDANFRRPAAHLQFDLQNTVGLSSVLARLSDLDEAVQQTQVANMEVLSCGPLPPSPADLLGSQAMQDLLAKMRDRYDAVILDGPPMLLVADGHVLASMVDGVAVVMSSRQTSRGVAMRTKRMLQSLRARVVGGILNRVRAEKGGYFRESFRAYYEYSGRQK